MLDADSVGASSAPRAVEEAPGIALIKPLRELRRDATLAALVAFRGHKQQAARALGITIKTLYNDLHKWGVPLDYGRPPGPSFATRGENGGNDADH